MNVVSNMDIKMAEFAERVPAKGQHISYLEKASEIISLYGEAISIMEGEKTSEGVAKIETISREIDLIVG